MINYEINQVHAQLISSNVLVLESSCRSMLREVVYRVLRKPWTAAVRGHGRSGSQIPFLITFSRREPLTNEGSDFRVEEHHRSHENKI